VRTAQAKRGAARINAQTWRTRAWADAFRNSTGERWAVRLVDGKSGHTQVSDWAPDIDRWVSKLEAA